MHLLGENTKPGSINNINTDRDYVSGNSTVCQWEKFLLRSLILWSWPKQCIEMLSVYVQAHGCGVEAVGQ